MDKLHHQPTGLTLPILAVKEAFLIPVHPMWCMLSTISALTIIFCFNSMHAWLEAVSCLLSLPVQVFVFLRKSLISTSLRVAPVLQYHGINPVLVILIVECSLKATKYFIVMKESGFSKRPLTQYLQYPTYHQKLVLISQLKHSVHVEELVEECT